MNTQFPVRRYVKVWVHKRKNPPRQNGKQSSSYTLEWVEFGRRQFMSLGRHATAAYARQARIDKEKELNSSDGGDALEPFSWADFRRKYLDTKYPGHDLPPKDRKAKEQHWEKSFSALRSERLAMSNFERIVIKEPGRDTSWCHDISSADRDRFINHRLGEVGSGESVDADLRNLRTVFNVMEEWNHRAAGTNPFAGRKKATIGERRKRAKQVSAAKKSAHYSRSEILALLRQADKEVSADPTNWDLHRLRALVYFEAYTGARLGEVLHLEWDREIRLEGGGTAKEIDLDLGIAFLCWKVEHGLKTIGAEAPIGLPDALMTVLREWKNLSTCTWVFPNSDHTPWTSGGVGYRPLDQLKALAKRAGIEHATWKMFRHSLNTHGKQWFGLTREQMRVQLRHEDEETQKHYDHADLQNLRSSVKDIDFRAK